MSGGTMTLLSVMRDYDLRSCVLVAQWQRVNCSCLIISVNFTKLRNTQVSSETSAPGVSEKGFPEKISTLFVVCFYFFFQSYWSLTNKQKMSDLFTECHMTLSMSMQTPWNDPHNRQEPLNWKPKRWRQSLCRLESSTPLRTRTGHSLEKGWTWLLSWTNTQHALV